MPVQPDPTHTVRRGRRPPCVVAAEGPILDLSNSAQCPGRRPTDFNNRQTAPHLVRAAGDDRIQAEGATPRGVPLVGLANQPRHRRTGRLWSARTPAVFWEPDSGGRGGHAPRRAVSSPRAVGAAGRVVPSCPAVERLACALLVEGIIWEVRRYPGLKSSANWFSAVASVSVRHPAGCSYEADPTARLTPCRLSEIARSGTQAPAGPRLSRQAERAALRRIGKGLAARRA
jgi:hypothetical protein